MQTLRRAALAAILVLGGCSADTDAWHTDAVVGHGQSLTMTLVDDGTLLLEHEDGDRANSIEVDVARADVPAVSAFLAAMDPAFLFRVRRDIGSRRLPAERDQAAFLNAEVALVNVVVPSEVPVGEEMLLVNRTSYTGCFLGCVSTCDADFESCSLDCGADCR